MGNNLLEGNSVNIFYAVVIVAHLGADPVFVEAWQTREPCEKHARELKGGMCVPVVAGTKYQIDEQVRALNQLLK